MSLTQQQIDAIYQVFLHSIKELGIIERDNPNNVREALEAFAFAINRSERAQAEMFDYARRYYNGYERKFDIKLLASNLVGNRDILHFIKSAYNYVQKNTNGGGSTYSGGGISSAMGNNGVSGFGGMSDAYVPAPQPQAQQQNGLVNIPPLGQVSFAASYDLSTQAADIDFTMYPVGNGIQSGPISVLSSQMGQFDNHRVSTSHVKCNLPVGSVTTAIDIISNYIPEELRRGNYLIAANIHAIKTIKGISSGKYQELIQQLSANLPKDENSISIKDFINAMRDFKQAEFNTIESIIVDVFKHRLFQWLRVSNEPTKMLTGFKSHKDIEEILQPSCKFGLVMHPGFEMVIKLITKSIYSELIKTTVATRNRNPGDLIISPYTYYNDPDGTGKTKYDVFNVSEDRDKILMALMQEMTVVRRDKVILITNMLEEPNTHPEFLSAWRNVVNSSKNEAYRYTPDRIVSLRQGAEPKEYLETFIPVTFIDEPNIVFPEKYPEAPIPGLDYF